VQAATRVNVEQTSHDEGSVKGSHHGDIEKPLQLLRYPRSKPICATRPVSEHGQPHMRSPLMAAAPRSRFRRAGLRKTRTILKSGISGHGLLRFVYPGSARTDQVLGNDGITLVYSLGNLHRNAFDNDTGGRVFPERDQ
jgi:hypothetical protein